MRIVTALIVLLAAQEAPKAPDNTEPMKKLEWLIGTWTGGVQTGPGTKAEAEYKMEWTLNKNFIKNDYWMKSGGKVVWHDTGVYGWDAGKKKYVGFNFGMDGTIGWAEQVDSTDKDWMLFEGRTSGPSENGKFRVAMKKVDKDSLAMKMDKDQDGKWVSMGEWTLKRKKAAK